MFLHPSAPAPLPTGSHYLLTPSGGWSTDRLKRRVILPGVSSTMVDLLRCSFPTPSGPHLSALQTRTPTSSRSPSTRPVPQGTAVGLSVRGFGRKGLEENPKCMVYYPSVREQTVEFCSNIPYVTRQIRMFKVKPMEWRLSQQMNCYQVLEGHPTNKRICLPFKKDIHQV